MKRSVGKNGFSLVEVLIAMLAMSILALTVGILLVYSWKAWRLGNESVQMQRDTTLALKMLTKEIRSCSITNIDTSAANAISFQPQNTSIKRIGGNLIHSSPDMGDFVLMRGTATEFVLDKKTNGVECIHVSLGYQTKSGNEPGEQQVNIHTRN